MEHSEALADNALLLEAFNTFSEASLQLEKSYNDLREHTRKLDLELRETNEKLRQSLVEQEAAALQLRGTLDALTSGTLVIDLDGVVRDINPAAARMIGVANRDVHYTKLQLPPEIQDFIYACIESTMPRGRNTVVTITVDGEQKDLDLGFNLVRPEGGGILSVLVIINDITLINRLQSQAKRNARLAAMGEMAAELAHEIRNPLGSIKLFAGLLEGDLEDRPDQASLATQISSGVQILENIVANMLTFSANVQPKREPIAVAKLLGSAIPLFEHERTQRRIALDYQEPPKKLTINGDEHLLKQVILNLCHNAIKAMDPDGTLKLRAKKSGEFVEILIEDDGCGIPETQLHKIFDPFYTTFKGGTGLGLSVVNQIVDKHGGAVDVKSKVGEGTAVFVSLPA